jgi:malate dehydrogenase (oxaloacetate-decarboxylating)(NADP+)
LSEQIRKISMPNSTLRGAANLLIMPNVDAANIAFNMLKVLGDGIAIGPILLGVARPAHILTPSATARGILNMTAFACVHAQSFSTDPESVHLQQRALGL